MGRGEYTSSNGTETKTYFYKDVQYGRIIATQSHNGVLQVGNMWGGCIHGHATFYDGENYPNLTNCMVNGGSIVTRGKRYTNKEDTRAFFKQDGTAFKAIAYNWFIWYN